MTTKSPSAAKRPYSSKPHALEPRGRPAAGQPVFSGATPTDPLVSVQVLKVRQSVWRELAEAAAEKTWHRSVLVRKILDEWVERRRKARRKGKKKLAS
jgi:hypothetical protein